MPRAIFAISTITAKLRAYVIMTVIVPPTKSAATASASTLPQRQIYDQKFRAVDFGVNFKNPKLQLQYLMYNVIFLYILKLVAD